VASTVFHMTHLTPIFAEASNSFVGQWFIVAIAAVGSIGGLIGIFMLFATSRELERQITANTRETDRLEARLQEAEAGRSKVLADMGEIKGQLIAFNAAFAGFIDAIRETSAARDETIKAFTSSLETFANVVDRNNRRSS
jgi:hypothetical protein